MLYNLYTELAFWLHFAFRKAKQELLNVQLIVYWSAIKSPRGVLVNQDIPADTRIPNTRPRKFRPVKVKAPLNILNRD